MSTQQPPQVPPFAKRSREDLQRSIADARKFYALDSKLIQSDRERLATAFGRKMTLYPILGLPIIFGGIMLPNLLKKRGWLPAKKNTRGLQVFLGFFGVFVGFKAATHIGTAYQARSLSDNPSAEGAYLMLSQYPPQVGSRYYSLTARNPDLALKDPDTVDWEHELMFPLMLVLKQRPTGVPGHPSSPHPQGQSQSNGPGPSPQVPLKSSSDQPTSSWDRIRQGIPNAPNTLNTSNAPNSPSLPRIQSAPIDSLHDDDFNEHNSSWLEKKQAKFDAMIDNIKPGGYDQDVDKEQESFDELIDRERQGLGIQDDFSESEKKW